LLLEPLDDHIAHRIGEFRKQDISKLLLYVHVPGDKHERPANIEVPIIQPAKELNWGRFKPGWP
jgi:hypothetical protein